MNHRLNKNNRGMTLVETMMALMILAITIGGICKLMLISKEASDRSRDHYIALNLAKNRLERAQTFPFGQLYQLAEENVIVGEDGTPGNGPFRRTTIVTNLSSDLIEMIVAVEVKDRVKLTFTAGSETNRTMFANIF